MIPDVEADRSWLFKHVVTQEVAYESLPFAIREELHESTARVIEAAEPAGTEQNLDLLAHHYWHSANLDKKREYLVKAGEAAQAELRERCGYRLLPARRAATRRLRSLACDAPAWRGARGRGRLARSRGRVS